MSNEPVKAFGRYELVSPLGRGGMAETWRARWVGDAGVSKSVLIKKVLPEFANDDAFISMFISEARISATLSHGNIAQVFDFGRVDGQYYLAMELVDGQPLHRVLRRAQKTGLQTLPIPLAVYIVLEMCRGLHYAHTRTDDKGMPLGIVHRDISPDNVLISYEGQVKIVDFGIAKARMQRNFDTEPGVVKGKFLYFSPEQARGKEVDARTDVWATGLVLYELLCGQMPVEGGQTAVMMRMAHGEFPSPKEVRKEIPSALNEIVMRALSVSLEGRFESANAFGDSLAAFLYSFAPRFSPMNLAYLVRTLFQPVLAEEGRELSVPQSFIEELTLWQTGTASVPALKPQGPHKPLAPNVASWEAQGPPTAPLPGRETGGRISTGRESSITESALDPEPARGTGRIGWLLGAGSVGTGLLLWVLATGSTERTLPPFVPPATPIVDTNRAERAATSGDPRPLSPSERKTQTAERLAQARVHYVDRKFAEAHSEAERCLDNEPDHSTCLLLSAASLARLGRVEEGDRRLRRFKEVPRKPEHAHLTVLLLDDYLRAVSDTVQVSETRPPPPESLSEKGDEDKGMLAPIGTRRTSEKRAQSVQSHVEAMRAALREKRATVAVEEGETCLERYPSAPECHLFLGAALALLERTSEAATHYRRFVELAPNHPHAARVEKLVAEYEAAR
ncbi:protein kinase [Myxococcus stipitatus]|uniref:serine/threonine protein kinase n=1 Tax=Myxococcus stipitatus TaxID=83455 RepID=UPI001F23FDFB|nr:serine/threonine-protein kinase [Myxococcus stipitatus]MCE9671151.1 protein kinase [Myxococcus stipitatus]